LPIEQKTRLST